MKLFFWNLWDYIGERSRSGDLHAGKRRMGNKNFPMRTKTYHGDVHLRDGMSDLRTLVDRTAEALENAVDVVERPHVPRSAPRTIPQIGRAHV